MLFEFFYFVISGLLNTKLFKLGKNCGKLLKQSPGESKRASVAAIVPITSGFTTVKSIYVVLL